MKTKYKYGDLRTWELLIEAIQDVHRGNGVLELKELKNNITEKYPNYKVSNFNSDLHMLSVNSHSRVKYYRNKTPRLTNTNDPVDYLYYRARGEFEVYDKVKRGVWEIYYSKNKLQVRLFTNSLLSDVSELIKNETISRTDIETRVLARIGQGQFRLDVMKNYPKCPITGIKMPELLRASHIKPWRECSDEERLDPYNGIMFAPHIDALFDQGFISFTDEGDMLVKDEPRVRETIQVMCVPIDIKIKIHERAREYLAWHREWFKKERDYKNK